MIVIYGSTTGNCERAAELIADAFGCEAKNVSNASADDLSHDVIVLGASTWGIGEMQDDFEPFLNTLRATDFTGKKVALFGTGDGQSFSDSFVDAIGEIYEIVSDKGAEVIGSVATEEYDYSESRAEIDGRFVGLPLDYDNDSDKVDAQVNSWIEVLKEVV